MLRHTHPAFDIDQKCAAVRRVLGGENANRIAAELQISPDRLHRWERRFLAGGRQAISRRGRARWAFARWNTALPWTALLVILLLTVYAATRFLQAPQP